MALEAVQLKCVWYSKILWLELCLWVHLLEIHCLYLIHHQRPRCLLLIFVFAVFLSCYVIVFCHIYVPGLWINQIKSKSNHSIKGALDKYNIIPQLFPKKVEILIPLEVLAWVMTACWVLHSRLTYFGRNVNISSIFYFSKATSINTQCSSLWDTLKMMLFTKYLIELKRIGRINWKFRHLFKLKSSTE